MVYGIGVGLLPPLGKTVTTPSFNLRRDVDNKPAQNTKGDNTKCIVFEADNTSVLNEMNREMVVNGYSPQWSW